MNPLRKAARTTIMQPFINFDATVGESSRIGLGAASAAATAAALAAASTSYSIDKTVNFSPLLKSNGNQVMPVKAMQLNNYVAVNSCVSTDIGGGGGGPKLTGGALTTTTTATVTPNVSTSQSPLASITLTTANGSRSTVVTDPKYTQNIQVRLVRRTPIRLVRYPY